ncbi:MAG: sigma-54 dependent transcriptional regulator [Nitrospirota bacterium]
MISPCILVVDDDENLLELLSIRLESSGYDVVAVSIEEKAIEEMRNRAFDLAIVDLQLSNRDGISLMQDFHKINPEIPVIILTAYGSIESAVESMQKGAFNYLTKPFDPQELLFQAKRALENRRLTTEIRRLKGLLGEQFDFSNIVARSEKMRVVLEKISHIAGTDSTVYIHGESGTGKELIAKTIHLASPRKDRPFIAINCAAIPEQLLESELFGHEKGAFTGAVQSTKGLFTEAHTGTIFLDEIGDMSLLIQAKFLRVLQEKQFYSVGGKQSINVDVRVIVATNKDLQTEVKEGRFREDLFYRIHVIPVNLPPLRERKEDILPLTDIFIKNFSRQMGKGIKGLTPDAIQRLMQFDWPGNVRELKNVIEYAVAMTQQDFISEKYILQEKKLSYTEPLKPLSEARAEFDKNYLIHLLEITGGNVTKAAKLAGKYRADFYNLIKKYSINLNDYKKN